MKNCATLGCTKHCKSHSKYCSRCAARKWAADHPISYALNKLRNNAKRRKIPFSLTLAQFAAFCAEHPNFMAERGRFSNCLSLDRRKSSKGYEIGNLRVLDVGTNVRIRYGYQYMEPEPPGYDLETGNPFTD